MKCTSFAREYEEKRMKRRHFNAEDCCPIAIIFVAMDINVHIINVITLYNVIIIIINNVITLCIIFFILY